MVHPHTGEEYEPTKFGRLVEGDHFRDQTPKGEPGSRWIKVSENLKDNARSVHSPEEALPVHTKERAPGLHTGGFLVSGRGVSPQLNLPHHEFDRRSYGGLAIDAECFGHLVNCVDALGVEVDLGVQVLETHGVPPSLSIDKVASTMYA